MANYASAVVNVALGEVGYLEKETNASLDNKTANAGDNNYTKYARDFDTKYPNFYNTKKQSVAWCDIFVDWCMVKAFGVETALKLLGQPLKSCGAGCSWSMKYYKQIGCFYVSGPKAGDQIFFYNSKKNDIAHTGLVYKVDSKYVYTVEGNTSSAAGVVANGGAVAKKKYALNYARIAGYGRPKYDAEPVTTTPAKPAAKPKVNAAVQAWQKAAIADGYKFPKYGADGDWGQECINVAQKAICKKQIIGYKNKNLTKIIQKAVGVTADGLFGNDTKKAVIAYQKKKGLTADGVVGLNTWKKILGV
jgi:peptidoglycan hydrolase-like protein with peptidoglycan-binding domain